MYVSLNAKPKIGYVGYRFNSNKSFFPLSAISQCVMESKCYFVADLVVLLRNFLRNIVTSYHIYITQSKVFLVFLVEFH